MIDLALGVLHGDDGVMIPGSKSMKEAFGDEEGGAVPKWA